MVLTIRFRYTSKEQLRFLTSSSLFSIIKIPKVLPSNILEDKEGEEDKEEFSTYSRAYARVYL